MSKYFMFKASKPIPDPTKKKTWATQEYIDGPVRIMAEKDGYAMVRRKGCMPFVIGSKYIIREENHD